MATKQIRKSGTLHNIPVRYQLAAWYRYRKGIVNVSGACSSWYDYSGNQRPLLQATASARPSINSDGSLTFDGLAQFMQASYTLIQPFTRYLAFMPLAHTDDAVIFDGSTGTTTLSQDTADDTYDINAGTALDYAGSFAVGTRGVIAVVFNGASSVVQGGNGAASITSTGSANTNNAGGNTLGADRSAANFSNIRVFEMADFSGAHDAFTRLQMLRYMARVAQVGGV